MAETIIYEHYVVWGVALLVVIGIVAVIGLVMNEGGFLTNEIAQIKNAFSPNDVTPEPFVVAEVSRKDKLPVEEL